MCYFEYKSKKGVDLRHWRVVAQAIGPLASWCFEDIAIDLYRSSQRFA